MISRRITPVVIGKGMIQKSFALGALPGSISMECDECGAVDFILPHGEDKRLEELALADGWEKMGDGSWLCPECAEWFRLHAIMNEE